MVIKLPRNRNATAEEEHMKLSDWRNTGFRLALVYVLAICSFQLYPLCLMPRTWGRSPLQGRQFKVKPRLNLKERFSIS